MTNPLTYSQWVTLNEANRINNQFQMMPFSSNPETITPFYYDVEDGDQITEVDSFDTPTPVTRSNPVLPIINTMLSARTLIQQQGLKMLKNLFNYKNLKILRYTVLILFILLLILISTCMVVFRLQWNNLAKRPGAVLAWNQTKAQEDAVTTISRLKRAEHYNLQPVEIKMNGLLQGIYWKPFPKPIIQKQKVLGISQVVVIDSTVISKKAKITTQMGRKLVKDHINGQMEMIQAKTLEYDLPLQEYWKQKTYREKMCFSTFAHCYFVDFQGTRRWPAKEIKADQCPHPGITIDKV
ncbi:uncharacterized protein LOC128660004 [Bombina bombina]|uniref:uncharacterized protein LOC128660004 n=1 Tax=Bombina bombina TaxID=8345 RepID=UPI00235A8604|nr:uncharacterized protein LOC128660004 [Bombina bombina]